MRKKNYTTKIKIKILNIVSEYMKMLFPIKKNIVISLHTVKFLHTIYRYYNCHTLLLSKIVAQIVTAEFMSLNILLVPLM